MYSHVQKKRDQVYDEVLVNRLDLKKKEDMNLLYLTRFIEKTGRKYKSGKNTIALIVAEVLFLVEYEFSLLAREM